VRGSAVAGVLCKGDTVGEDTSTKSDDTPAGAAKAEKGPAEPAAPAAAAEPVASDGDANGAAAVGPDDARGGDEGEQEAELDELSLVRAELASTKDRMLRIAADFDNFRKRTRKEQEEARTRGREEVLKEILPVFDNLERAIQAAGTKEASPATQAIVAGVAMVQKQFEEGLGRFGLKRFSAKGQGFDPNLHEALAQVETDEHPAGTVVEEYQKGYMLGERLLRPATVVVARPKAAPRPAPSEAGGEAGVTAPAECGAPAADAQSGGATEASEADNQEDGSP